LKRYCAASNLPQDRPLRPDDFKVEAYLADHDYLFEQHESCGGDFIYAADAFWGIPWLEAVLGCELWANHQSGSIHAERLQKFNPEYFGKFQLNEPWSIKAVEFLKKISEHSKGRYPLATTRMRGIVDLLAVIYGNENLIFKMMESPAEIRLVCKALMELWIAFAQLQLDHIPLFHGGIGSFYYNMWAPAKSVWHQEDAAALLSPDLYEQFILPCDLKIADSFGGCFMHMHPTGFYPYKQLILSNMTCLELHIDEGGASARELFEIHKTILAHKPLLIWGNIPEQDLDWIFSNLPAGGLAVNTMVDSLEQAHYLWKKYIR
jgi:hypothetical protein